MERKEQLKQWMVYIGELYSDNSIKEDFVLVAELEGPPIMQSEVEQALSRTIHERQQVWITFMQKNCQH